MASGFRRATRLARQARTGASVLVSKVLRRDERGTAERVTKSLGEMKGLGMKLGQVQSYQNEGLSDPWQEALATLQQDAPSMSAKTAAKVVAAELGAPPEQLFEEWNPTPIAAASVGQVHRAIAHDGRVVAVKVQFPYAEEAFQSDVDNLSSVVRTAARNKVTVDGNKVDPGMLSDVFAEFGRRVVQETDYRREADNQELVAAAFAVDPKIHVPAVHRDLSARRVLTTEFVEGARFDEAKGWSQAERNAAGETVFRFHYTCALQVGTYNMDPHPGNYLFRPGGEVSFLDFGAVDSTADAFLTWMKGALGGSALDGAPGWLVDQLAEEGPRPMPMPRHARPVRRSTDTPPAPPLPVPGVLFGLQAVLAQLGSVCDWRAIIDDIGFS